MEALSQTPRTRVRRAPHRAVTETPTCCTEYLMRRFSATSRSRTIGRPTVIPMGYGRDGDRLYLHGSTGSRLMRSLAGGPLPRA